MVIETLSAVTGIAELIGKAISFFNDTTVTDEGFIRAYYLEVSKNIEILKSVNIPALNKKKINSPEFKSLINSLETEIGAALLCSDTEKRNKVFDFLKQGLEIKIPKNSSFTLETGEEDTVNPPQLYELRVDVLKAVWFTVQKIELLKALTTLNSDLLSHGFNLNVRIGNILERFKNISQKLAENDAMSFLRSASV